MTLTCGRLSLLFALTLNAPTSAQTPPILTDAVRRLRDAAPYSWTITTKFPGAPFTVAPVKGTTDTHQFSVLTLGNGQGVAVARGNARVLQTAAGWRSLNSGDNLKDADQQTLGESRVPADELSDLAASLEDITVAEPDLLVGVLPSEAAKRRLLSGLKGRIPGGRPPDIQSVTGRVHLWITNGLPIKYVITLRATLSLPLGTKDVERVTTTEIRDMGTTQAVIPAEARRAIELLGEPQ